MRPDRSTARRTAGRTARSTAGCLLAVVVLAGCTQGSPLTQEGVASPDAGDAQVSDCSSAFAAASSADPGPEQDEDLWATFDACADLDEFSEAAAVHPDVLADEPEAFVTSACRDEPAVAGSVLCAASPPA